MPDIPEIELRIEKLKDENGRERFYLRQVGAWVDLPEEWYNKFAMRDGALLRSVFGVPGGADGPGDGARWYLERVQDITPMPDASVRHALNEFLDKIKMLLPRLTKAMPETTPMPYAIHLIPKMKLTDEDIEALKKPLCSSDIFIPIPMEEQTLTGCIERLVLWLSSTPWAGEPLSSVALTEAASRLYDEAAGMSVDLRKYRSTDRLFMRYSLQGEEDLAEVQREILDGLWWHLSEEEQQFVDKTSGRSTPAEKEPDDV